MNTLKSLFIIAIMGAIAYGAYVSITRKQQLGPPPADAPAFAEGASGGPPNVAISTGEFAGGLAPPAGANAAVAPPFAPGAPAHGMAPRAVAASLPGRSIAPLSTQGGGMAAQDTPPAPGVAATPYGPYAGAAPGVGSLPAAAPGVASPSTAPPSAVMAGMSVRPQPPNRYDTLLKAAEKELDDGRLVQAHLALSTLHNDPAMPPAQASRVRELLDQLAGHVIYSREHLLEQPHTVQPGETLEQIAQRYNVPWQLLANINRVRDPRRLEPGAQLKVVRGPFHAIIRLADHELTLMLAGRYAGRFPIGVGRDFANIEGAYVVCDKTVNPQYYGPGGGQIDADNPNNPLGEYWIGLADQTGRGSRIGIHGTHDPTSLHATSGRGQVRLSEKDVQDIFGILSVGPVASKVTIMR